MARTPGSGRVAVTHSTRTPSLSHGSPPRSRRARDATPSQHEGVGVGARPTGYGIRWPVPPSEGPRCLMPGSPLDSTPMSVREAREAARSWLRHIGRSIAEHPRPLSSPSSSPTRSCTRADPSCCTSGIKATGSEWGSRMAAPSSLAKNRSVPVPPQAAGCTWSNASRRAGAPKSTTPSSPGPRFPPRRRPGRATTRGSGVASSRRSPRLHAVHGEHDQRTIFAQPDRARPPAPTNRAASVSHWSIPANPCVP